MRLSDSWNNTRVVHSTSVPRCGKDGQLLRRRPVSPRGGVASAGYCQGVTSLDWDSAKRHLRRAGEFKPGAAVADRLKAGGRTALDATAERSAQVMAAAQALLASDLSSDLNNLVAAAVKGSATIYDKAMDANYLDPLLRPGLGGSYHRLFDGGHTIAGAVRAARGASPDDTIIEEVLGTVQALLRDAATPPQRRT